MRATVVVIACVLLGLAAPARSRTYHEFAEDVTHLGDASTLLAVGLALGLSGSEYDGQTSVIYAEALVTTTSPQATEALLDDLQRRLDAEVPEARVVLDGVRSAL